MDATLPHLWRTIKQRVAYGFLAVLALSVVWTETVAPALLPPAPPCVGRDMLRFKDVTDDKDAVEVRFTMANQKILSAAEVAHDQHGHACVVTAGKDGRHRHDSKHYDNQALDFRTWHLSGQPNPCRSYEQCSPTCKAVFEGMKMRLGKDYDVLFEPDNFNDTGQQIRWQHIHVEHDPKS